jgi:hypothetical protein
VTLFALLLGCPEDEGTTPEAPPTLAELQAEVFTPWCAFSTCHAAPGASGLVLDDGETWASVVDVASADAPAETLVIPGDAANSYLMKKLRGDSGIVGDPMPLGAPLDEATIARVAAWIDAGATDE